MKKLLFLLFIYPQLLVAQTNTPRFENDTLHTSGGYKIFKGQTLYLGTGTSDAGYFTFIKFHPSQVKNNTYSLKNSTIFVSKLRAYKYFGADNNSIRINGTVTYKDGKREETDIVMNFERATEDYNGLPSELIVPEAQKIKRQARAVAVQPAKQDIITEPNKQAVPADIKNLLIADELKKLFDLYKAGALTKEEYDAQKKKLLDRQ